MFFSSIKEINRLISKGMSSIYLKVTIKKTDVLKPRFSQFKKFVSRSVFGELQVTQISFNFKNSCKFKIRGLDAKLDVAFLLF